MIRRSPRKRKDRPRRRRKPKPRPFSEIQWQKPFEDDDELSPVCPDCGYALVSLKEMDYWWCPKGDKVFGMHGCAARFELENK